MKTAIIASAILATSITSAFAMNPPDERVGASLDHGVAVAVTKSAIMDNSSLGADYLKNSRR
ncbi:MAG: hypothetical protein WBA91_12545 [Paracoccaceae bacterium]